jgi:hypothetical protein
MSTAGVQGLEPGRAVPFRPVLRLPRPLVRFGAEALPGGSGSGEWAARVALKDGPWRSPTRPRKRSL